MTFIFELIDLTLKLKPDYDVAYITKAGILLKLNKFEEACKNKRRAIELGLDFEKLDDKIKKELEEHCR
jgi:predicted RNA polymerase sigma factor